MNAFVEALATKIKQRGGTQTPLATTPQNLFYAAKAFAHTEGIESRDSVVSKGAAQITSLRDLKKSLFATAKANRNLGANWPDTDKPIKTLLEEWGKTKVPFRWTRFRAYDENGWVMANNAAMFGGVAPSSWANSGYQAQHISFSNYEYLRTLFNKKGYAGYNAMIGSWVYYPYQTTPSTDAAFIMALFRIKNKTANSIIWTPYFYYSCYGSHSNYASVSLNNGGNWSASTDTTNGKAYVDLSIPANQTSTVIFVSSRGPVSTTTRVQMGFYNNCLKLPSGLEFVDDLDAL